MEDNEEILEDSYNEHEYPLRGGKLLAVITPQGYLILEKQPYLSFIRLIEYVGYDAVAAFDIKAKEEMPLLSKVRLNSRDYQPGAEGWFVYTNLNMKNKIKLIELIGEKVGMKFTCSSKLF